MIRLDLDQKLKLSMADYIERNKSAWEKKVQYDVESEYYNVKGFLKGQNILDELELENLGSVKGKELLHLQCYFGLESLALERMGATVTGLDFCENAIFEAKKLRQTIKLNSGFVCANVYDATDVLTKKFDIVFSSYGSICWLPDLKQWANSIFSLLKPGGILCIVDFHPLLISFNLMRSDSVRFSYYNMGNPLILHRTGTYADVNAKIDTIEYNWNHSLSEILGNLISSGMKIESFNEYPYIPLNAFPNLNKAEDGFHHVPDDLFPITFSIAARK